MLLDGYTETALELYWNAIGWGTLELHVNYTEMPLDGVPWYYIEIPLYLPTAPGTKPNYLLTICEWATKIGNQR